MSEPNRPSDIILVRHGQSEANIIHEAQKVGKKVKSYRAFHERHDSEYRLSANGIEQAKKAGGFMLEHCVSSYEDTRYLVSPYNRAMETAVQLGISDNWEIRDEIREREWAEASSLSPEERREKYEANERLKEMSYYYWRTPGGESIADVVHNRVRLIIDTIYRENAGQKVVMVTHGEFIWAMRTFLERLHPIEFNEQDRNSAYKISNCFVLHYSRKNPDNGELADHFEWRRGICPWDSNRSWSQGEWTSTPIRRRSVTTQDMKKWYEPFTPLDTS
jgi:broad specificity phosphatase PhoE